MGERTQISPKGPSLHLSLSILYLLRNLPLNFSTLCAFITLRLLSRLHLGVCAQILMSYRQWESDGVFFFGTRARLLNCWLERKKKSVLMSSQIFHPIVRRYWKRLSNCSLKKQGMIYNVRVSEFAINLQITQSFNNLKTASWSASLTSLRLPFVTQNARRTVVKWPLHYAF